MHAIKNDLTSQSQITSEAINLPFCDKPSTRKKCDWSVLIPEWEKSGLTKLEFCRLHGLNYNTFSYHRGKSSNNYKKHSKLLPVKMRTDRPPSSLQPLVCFTLHFPNGTRLTIPEHADPSMLKVLLSVLGEQ